MNHFKHKRIALCALAFLLLATPCVHAQETGKSKAADVKTEQQNAAADVTAENEDKTETDEVAPTEGAQSDGADETAYEIKPLYAKAEPFAEGYAAVQTEGKWGYIDESGQAVIAAAYDYAAPFSEGRALVGKKDAETGSFFLYVIEATDAAPLPLTDHSGAPVSVVPATLFTAEGQQIPYYFVNQYLYLPACRLLFDYSGRAAQLDADSICSDGLVRLADTDDRFVFADTTGAEVVSIAKEQGDYRFESVYPFAEGRAAAWVRYLPYEREGFAYPATLVFVNRLGQIVFSGAYDMAYTDTYHGEGVTLVHDGVLSLRDAETRKWGAIDMGGNVLIPFIYDQMQGHSEGLVAVKKDGLWGYADVSGNCVIEPQYTAVGAFCQGMALAQKDGKTYFVNRKNEIFSEDGLDASQFLTEGGILRPTGALMPIYANGAYGYARITAPDLTPSEDETAPWSYGEVTAAIAEGLVPTSLRNQYTRAITRVDFAKLLMQTLTRCSGKSAEALLAEHKNMQTADLYEQNPFYDTNEKDVLLANQLGLIQGVSANSFAPGSFIKRQDAAALLQRAAQLLGQDNAAAGAPDFTDSSTISDYAKAAVSYVTQRGIMNGVGDGQFAPNGTYTKEQAILTMHRMYAQR